jgi:hypothetical protein
MKQTNGGKRHRGRVSWYSYMILMKPEEEAKK